MGDPNASVLTPPVTRPMFRFWPRATTASLCVRRRSSSELQNNLQKKVAVKNAAAYSRIWVDDRCTSVDPETYECGERQL
jgi:hypothetical protein